MDGHVGRKGNIKSFLLSKFSTLLSCNFYTVRSTHFKCIRWFLEIVQSHVTTTVIQFQTSSMTLRKFLALFCILPRPLASNIHWFAFCHCALLGLIVLLSKIFFEIHPHCWVYRFFFLIVQFISLSVDAYLNFFQFGTIMNNATMNFWVYVFSGRTFSFLLSRHLEVDAGLYVNCMFNLICIYLFNLIYVCLFIVYIFIYFILLSNSMAGLWCVCVCMNTYFHSGWNHVGFPPAISMRDSMLHIGANWESQV